MHSEHKLNTSCKEKILHKNLTNIRKKEMKSITAT